MRRAIPLVVFGLALIILAVVPTAYYLEYGQVYAVFEDTTVFGKVSRLAGLISDLGITVWVAAAAVVLHGFHRLLRSGRRLIGRDYQFYLFAVLLLSLLAVDDRLMIHEWIDQRSHWPFVVEWHVLAIYGAAAVIGAWRFWRYVRGPSQGWLWLAFALLWVSYIVDRGPVGHPLVQLLGTMPVDFLEDGSKFLGVCALFLHLFNLMVDPPCAEIINRRERTNAR